MCEQNPIGLLSTVPPPEGAEWGPIEKFAPPHAQIRGQTPIFRFSFKGTRSEGLSSQSVDVAVAVWHQFARYYTTGHFAQLFLPFDSLS